MTPIPVVGAATDSQTAPPPFPLALDGVQLQAAGPSAFLGSDGNDGLPVPIAGVSPTSVSFPATWDLPDNPTDVEIWVSSASASQFVPAVEVGFQDETFIYDEQLGYPTLVAVHQNFLSLVTTASPAKPGELIHLYAKDLGPVIPAPPAGLPTPLEPLSVLATPIACTLGVQNSPSPTPVNITFAGLAPDLLNVFQVDVQMPASFEGSPSVLACVVGYPSVGLLINGDFRVQ